jgi:hypothetical protein
MFPHGETVTVLTAGTTTDPYSNETTQSWEVTPTSVDVPNVLVADGGSIEPVQEARNAVDSDFDLIFQAPVTVTPTPQDRVVVRGLTCEVAGRPFLWKWAATPGEAGLVVKCKIREG